MWLVRALFLVTVHALPHHKDKVVDALTTETHMPTLTSPVIKALVPAPVLKCRYTTNLEASSSVGCARIRAVASWPSHQIVRHVSEEL